MTSLKNVDSSICYRQFLNSFCKFCGYKTVVEIGVHKGQSTAYLCDAVKQNNGILFGYDYWGDIGVYKKTYQKEYVETNLINQGYGGFFKLTKVNTTTDEFDIILKNDTSGNIDFAFIDGSHSYDGVTNDFLKVYPFLTEEGSIAFHDTYNHTGCRKFVIDLYEKYYDGTYDIINLPYGQSNGRYGLTLLTKRSYPLHPSGITHEEQDPNLLPDEVYKSEKTWYVVSKWKHKKYLNNQT